MGRLTQHRSLEITDNAALNAQYLKLWLSILNKNIHFLLCLDDTWIVTQMAGIHLHCLQFYQALEIINKAAW
jgi:hypothetical protein